MIISPIIHKNYHRFQQSVNPVKNNDNIGCNDTTNINKKCLIYYPAISFKSNNNDSLKKIKKVPQYSYQSEHIRTKKSTEQDLTKVYNNYKKALNEISKPDIERSILNIEKNTDYSREEILSAMQRATQFANIRSLLTINDKLVENNIGKISSNQKNDKKNFGLNSSLNYLLVQKMLGNLNGENTAIFLDENKLEQLEQQYKNKHSLEIAPDSKTFILSGFNDGITFLNRTKNLENTTLIFLKNKDIDRKTIERAEKLGLTPILICNQQEATVENIYNQLKPEQISKDELNAVIDATVIENIDSVHSNKSDIKDGIITYLNNSLVVYTPETLSIALKKMFQDISKFAKEKGKSDNDIIYAYGNNKKSYALINHQYQLINDIPQKQFIPMAEVESQLKKEKLKNKVVVILDDCAMSGSSFSNINNMLYSSYSYQLNKGNNNIVLAPIYLSIQATKILNSQQEKFNRKGKDKIICYQHEQNNWSNNIRNKYEVLNAIGDNGYDYYYNDIQRSCTIFPYMSPDNNSEFASVIALFHNPIFRNTNNAHNQNIDRLNNIKSYTQNAMYIAEKTQELLDDKTK